MPDRRDAPTSRGHSAEHVVETGHDVLAVLRAPCSPRARQKLLPVARGASEVDLEHEVAVGCEQLTLEVEAVAVSGMRATVTAHHERVRSAVRTIPIRI